MMKVVAATCAAWLILMGGHLVPVAAAAEQRAISTADATQVAQDIASLEEGSLTLNKLLQDGGEHFPAPLKTVLVKAAASIEQAKTMAIQEQEEREEHEEHKKQQRRLEKEHTEHTPNSKKSKFAPNRHSSTDTGVGPNSNPDSHSNHWAGNLKHVPNSLKHPKVRHHTKLHEKILSGDDSVVTWANSKLNRHMKTTTTSAASQQQDGTNRRRILFNTNDSTSGSDSNPNQLVPDRQHRALQTFQFLDLSNAAVTCEGSGCGPYAKGIVDGNLALSSFRSALYWGTHVCDSNVAPAVIIDMGKDYEINTVNLYHYGDGRLFCGLSLKVSRDGTNWITVMDLGSANGPEETPTQPQVVSFNPIVARYVRHSIGKSTASNWAHLLEVKIKGRDPPPPTPSPTTAPTSPPPTTLTPTTAAPTVTPPKPLDVSSASVKCANKDGNTINCNNGAGILDGQTADSTNLNAIHWATSTCDPNQANYVEVDLKGKYQLTSVTLFHFADGRRFCGQRLQLSTDGMTWNTVYELRNDDYGPLEKPGQGHEVVFFPQMARFIRHSIGKSNVSDWAHLIEMDVMHNVQPRDQAQEDCEALVTCLKTWTLYDVIAFFFWDDISEDGTITTTTRNFDSENVIVKARQIFETISRFDATNFQATRQLPAKCNGLMRLFYKSAEGEAYVEHQSSTWRDVCRAEGSTRFVTHKAIETKLSNVESRAVFESLVFCASKLGGSSFFFDAFGTARLPVAANPSAIDKFGKVQTPENAFTYRSAGVLDLVAAKLREIHYQNVLIPFVLADTCKQQVSSHYKNILDTTHGAYIDASVIRDYPDVQIACNKVPATSNYDCTLKAADMITPLCSFPQVTNGGCPTAAGDTCDLVVKINSVFSATGEDFDTATRLVLGDKVGAGLACAHKVSPGFCCLDDVSFSFDSRKWGEPYSCSLGESACINKGPALSGFSEHSCNVYSGTYCPNPRPCGLLRDCIEYEKGYALSHKKDAYRKYLEGAPEITDPSKESTCEEVREYFGFEATYPNDQEVCEDIAFLRKKKDFDDLDKFAQEIIAATSAPINIADTAPPTAALADLEPQLTPEDNSGGKITPDYIKKQKKKLYDWEQVTSTAEELVELLDGLDCPHPDLNVYPCALYKNIAMIILIVFRAVANRFFILMEFNYAQDDTLSDFNFWEMYRQTKANVLNQGILRDNQEQLRLQIDAINTQSTDNADLAFGEFKTTGDYMLSQIRDGVVASMTKHHAYIHNNLTAVEGRLVSKLGSCSPSVRRQLSSKTEVMVPAKFAGCNVYDEDLDGVINNCEEDQFPPVIEIPIHSGIAVKADGTHKLAGKSFRNPEAALTHMRETLSVTDDCAPLEALTLSLDVVHQSRCSLSVAATPIHVEQCHGKNQSGALKQFQVDLDTQAPQIACGFDSSHTMVGHKTLFLEAASEGLIDSSFFYKVTDECSEFVDIDIAVHSNEYEGPNVPVVLNKVVDATNKAEQVELFLSPTRCNNDLSMAPTTSGFCYSSDTVDKRVYEIHVSATDAAGWTTKDTCRVVVLPSEHPDQAEEYELRSGRDGRVLNVFQGQELVDASENFVVAKLSFRTRA